MPERAGNRTIFTLVEICRSIKKTLDERYTSRFWAKAELTKLNFYKYSGHAYPDLVQKDDGRIIAQMRGVIWKSDLIRIQSAFLRDVGQPLSEGIEMLFEASITFDAVHGISLRIHQIDTTFTLGHIEREKRLTIERLKSDGLLDANKNKTLRELPKNIAVISVETSKGWADFRQVVAPYIEHFGLFFMLFPALLQGDEAVHSIRSQLRKILSVQTHFDAVMIIRGGGGEAGLTCYNSYELCKDLATFPLPVLTGIGHSTNQTVAEMIAYHHAITPTALGEYYIELFKTKESELKLTCDYIVKLATRSIQRDKSNLKNQVKILFNTSKRHTRILDAAIRQMISTIDLSVQKGFTSEHNKISELCRSFHHSSDAFFRHHEREMSMISRFIRIQHPDTILRKGYAYLISNEKTLTSISQLSENQIINIILQDGKATARVLSKANSSHNEQEKDESTGRSKRPETKNPESAEFSPGQTPEL